MPTVTVRLPRPHQCQKQILDASSRFNVIACGRRFGKTVLGINRLVGPALAGKEVGWFSPEYKYLTEAWRDLVRILGPVTSRVLEQEKRIELLTGGVVECWSLSDPDAGRSRKYAHVVIDEAAKVKHLEVAWEASIRATLTDYRGTADFLSTPKGRNFFWKAYRWGQEKKDGEWSSATFPTRANPYIDPLEIESARRQLPERVFAQEYEAAFLEESGGVFRKVMAAIDAGRSDCSGAELGATYSLGVDLARVEDFTVITAIGPTEGGLRQVYFERFNQISWERQIAAIAAASRRYGKARVVIDSTGLGDPIVERLARSEGVPCYPYHFTNASKGALIDGLALSIEQGRIRLMDVPEQTDELLAYEYELLPSRLVRTGAPEGMHDDTVIALALAHWGASRSGLDRSETPAERIDRQRAESVQAEIEYRDLDNPQWWGETES